MKTYIVGTHLKYLSEKKLDKYQFLLAEKKKHLQYLELWFQIYFNVYKTWL